MKETKAIKRQLVAKNWNKFISTLDAKNSKLHKTELKSLLTATTMKMNSKYCKPSP